MNKTGWGQLGIVLALSRIFSEAANFPSDDINYGMQRFIVIIVSYILLAAVLVPIFLWVKKYGEVSIYGTSRTAAVIAVLYLLLAGIMTFTRLQFYASSTIFDAAPPWLIIIFAGIVCLYGLFKGLPAVLRTGVIAAAGFALLLITVGIGIAKNIRPDYLYPPVIDNSSAFMSEILSEFSKNAEAVIFGAVCSGVRKEAVKSLYVFLPLSIGALILMTFLYNTVLGEYLDITNFPFYALASLSDISVLQRLDGLDVVIWIMAAVIKLSLIMLSVFSVSLSAFGKRKTAFIISCSVLGAATLSSLWFSVNTKDFLVFADIMKTGIPLFIAAFLVPLIVLISYERKRKKEAKRLEAV